MENMDIAAAENMPLCQDCGYVTIFAEVGQDIVLNGSLTDALQAGVELGYSRGWMRQSVIKDALTDRTTRETARPAKIYVDLVSGDRLQLTVMPKGGGSDNAGRLKMMHPTCGENEIVEFVTETVAETGINACPPLFVGVGIGGSFDSVALSAKKALLRDMRKPSSDPVVRALEARLLVEINKLGIGPAGLGGETTALAVAVVTGPTHMACLPVAVNISCNHLRSAVGEL
jgi:fumarate hydratase subunit alpha